MSFSDFILVILVLAGIACALWILDINPYSKQLQVYNQTCTEMILDNTYCKGKWVDDPVMTFIVDKENNLISGTIGHQPNETPYSNCSVLDRKNWSCIIEQEDGKIHATDGKITYENVDVSEKRQITRLEWLQNRLLAMVGS